MNRRVLPVIAGFLVVGALLDLVVGYAPFPGYSAGLGLVGTILITFAAKFLGSRVVQRPETYYPEDVVPDVQPDLVGDADLRAELEAVHGTTDEVDRARARFEEEGRP